VRPYDPRVESAPASPRIRIAAEKEVLRIDILPPVALAELRRRLWISAAVLLALALLSIVRLTAEWHRVVRFGPGILPLPLLVGLTGAVVVGVPLTVAGLAALFFSEETLRIDAESITQRIDSAGRGRLRSVRRGPNVRLSWTIRPISPWWTWTFHRLAVDDGSTRLGVGATLGEKEKRALAAILERAIGYNSPVPTR